MIRLDIPAVLVQYDAEASLMRAIWRPGYPIEFFRPALEQFTEFSRHHTVHHWLINMDQLPPLDSLVQGWIMREWFPAMAATPVQHLALVLPLDLHNQMVATAPMDEPDLQMSFELHFFTDEASAFAWLLSDGESRPDLQEEWHAALTQHRVYPDASATSGSFAVH